MSREAEFLQGPENAFSAPMGAANLSAGAICVMTGELLVLADDGATLPCGAIHEDGTASQTPKVVVDAFVPGSIWLFATTTAFTTLTKECSIACAGSGLVDGGTAGDPCIGRRVFHDREVDEEFVAVRIEPHVHGEVA